MSTIYLKATGIKANILSPRESTQRAFDFGAAWSEIRIGMFLTNVASTDDNAAGGVETVTVNNIYDQMQIGIKNSSDTSVPGEAGSLFVGAGAGVSGTSYHGDAYYAAGNGLFDVFGYAGVTRVAGSGGVDGPSFPADPAPATGYCGFYCLKFVLSNRGLASQSFSINSSKTTPISGADYSPAALRTLMGAFAGAATARTLDWNDGAAARTLPDAVYVRMPFYNNRIRISCIRISVYA